MLSHPLAIVALVSRYLTNKLVARQPLPGRNLTFADPEMTPDQIIGYYPQFPVAIPVPRVRTDVILPRSPVSPLRVLPRLACLIHAANVHSEPGSNPLRIVFANNTSKDIVAREQSSLNADRRWFELPATSFQPPAKATERPAISRLGNPQ